MDIIFVLVEISSMRAGGVYGTLSEACEEAPLGCHVCSQERGKPETRVRVDGTHDGYILRDGVIMNPRFAA